MPSPATAPSSRRSGLGRWAGWLAGVMWSLSVTVGAGAEDREVAHIGDEPVTLLQRPGERRDDVRRDLDDLRAVPAHEVDMLRARRRVVGRRTVGDVRVAHQPELL